MDAGHDAQERTGRLARRIDRLRRDHAVARTSGDPTSRAVADALADALAEADRADRAGSSGTGDRATARTSTARLRRRSRADAHARRTLHGLRGHGWTSLHELHWPGRPGVLLDEVLIGPGGVVVVDATRWTRDLTVTGGHLHQDGRPHDRELDALVDAVAAVTALVGPAHRSAVTAVVCPPGTAGPVPTAAGVQVVGHERLGAHLASLPVRLTPYDVADLGRRLSRELGGRLGPELLTTAALDRAEAARTSATGTSRPGTRGSRARVAARTEAVTAPTRHGLRRAVRRADVLALALLGAVVVALAVDPASLATAGEAVGDFVASWVVPETLLPGTLPPSVPGGAGPVATG